MQTVTRDRAKATATPFTRGLGEHDLWDLWLLDEAEEMPCGSIRTFLHYLCSKGTKRCEILNAEALAMGSAVVKLIGPLADDERNHLLRYRFTRGSVGRLEEPEKDLLVSKLIEHCPTDDGKSHQKMLQALTAVGLSFA